MEIVIIERFCLWLFFILYGMKVYVNVFFSPELGFILFHLPIIIATILTFFVSTYIKRPKRIDKWFSLFLLFQMISIMRGGVTGEIDVVRVFADIFSFIIINLFFLRYIYLLRRYNLEVSIIINDIIIGLILFIVVNLVGTFMLHLPSPEQHVFLQFGGIKTKMSFFEIRPYLPFVSTLRRATMLCGLLSILGLFYYIRYRGLNRLIPLVLVISVLFIIFLFDARMIFVNTLLCILITIFFVVDRKYIFLKQFTFLLIFVLIFLPFIYLIIFYRFGLKMNAVLTLSGRVQIWSFALIKVFSKNLLFHLFGNGAYGQTEAGISEYFSHLFRAWGKDHRVKLHNFWLQMYYDQGLIGIFVYLSLAISVLKKGIHLRFYLKKENLLIIIIITIFLFSIFMTEHPIPTYDNFILLPLFTLPYYILKLSLSNLSNKITKYRV